MIDANDPDRCQATIPGGQCQKLAIPGKKCCQTHARRVDPLRCYVLTNKTIGDTARRHAGADEIKSLRDEIALMRALVELRLNAINGEVEMIASAPGIQQMILGIEKLVSACHTMEIKLGNLLDKNALITLAQKIITIIDTEIGPDVTNRDEIIGRIGEQILDSIMKQENL